MAEYEVSNDGRVVKITEHRGKLVFLGVPMGMLAKHVIEWHRGYERDEAAGIVYGGDMAKAAGSPIDLLRKSMREVFTNTLALDQRIAATETLLAKIVASQLEPSQRIGKVHQ